MNQIFLDEDILWITTKKYELFLSYGKIGMDAYLLYSHLMYTARLQHSNSVWANNRYIRDGLRWTKERLLKAKNLLRDLELIGEKKDRNEKGQLGKPYIIVKTKASPFEINNIKTSGLENQPVDNPVGGFLTTNALTNKEMLERENKCLNKRGTFVPPSLEEVNNYLKEIGESRFTANSFIDFYQMKGWMVGKNKMKDWKAAIRTWQQRTREYPAEQEPTVSDERIAELSAQAHAKYGKKK